MPLRIWLLVALVCAPQLAIASERSNRIIGGVAVNAGELPYMVSLQKGTRHFCGGSLIAKNWVLTAAHCVRGGSTSGLNLRIGMLKQGEHASAENFTAKRIISHPDYNSSKTDYDYALIELDGSSKATPVALNRETLDLPDEEDKAPSATTAGWGTTSEGGSISSSLLKVDVPMVSAKNCEEAYPNKITKQMICAGFIKGGKDSCQGDSGGPLLMKNDSGENVLIGVVSWGQGCARPKKFGVYAEVYGATSWIENQLSK